MIQPNSTVIRRVIFFSLFVFSLAGVLTILKNHRILLIPGDVIPQVLFSILPQFFLTTILLVLSLSRRLNEKIDDYITFLRQGRLIYKIFATFVIFGLFASLYLFVLPQIKSTLLLLIWVLQSILILFGLLVLYYPSGLRLQFYLSTISFLIGLLVIELLFFLWNGKLPGIGPSVLDYSELLQYSNAYEWPYNEGGALRPAMNVLAIGDSPNGYVNWITNSKGFRNDDEFNYEPNPGVLRIILAGDSFIAGYRIDQEEFLGQIIQKKLQAVVETKGVEVLNACVQAPGTGWLWLQDEGLKYQPDLVILAITLGNDIATSYIELDPNGPYQVVPDKDFNLIVVKPEKSKTPASLNRPPLSELVLPLDAYQDYEPVEFVNIQVKKILNRLETTRLAAKLLSLSIGTSADTGGIRSGYWDLAESVHAFDNVHGLGFFYSKKEIPEVETSFERLKEILVNSRDLVEAHDAQFVVVLIPQRFQVSSSDWYITNEQYLLNPEAFDLDQPNHKIMSYCQEARLNCLDLTPSFRIEVAQHNTNLYLPMGDMHWNRNGHYLAGSIVSEYIFQTLLDDSGDKSLR